MSRVTANNNIYFKDALMLNEGVARIGMDECDGYQLTKLSPAIGSGVYIENPSAYPCNTDFFGNPIDENCVNIGAYSGKGVDYVDNHKYYYVGENKYVSLVDFEAANEKATNQAIDAVHVGDTTTWLSVVSVNKDENHLCKETNSTQGIKMMSKVSYSSSCKVELYIGTNGLNQTKCIRIWCDGNGTERSASALFAGSENNYLISFKVPANGGWVYINWNETFYNTKTYKYEIPKADSMFYTTTSILFSTSLPAGECTFYDSLQACCNDDFGPLTVLPSSTSTTTTTKTSTITSTTTSTSTSTSTSTTTSTSTSTSTSTTSAALSQHAHIFQNGVCITCGELLGDVNADKSVNIKDLLAFKKYLASVGAINISVADVNCDGVVDAKDVISVNKYLVGII